jgi:nicotinamide mononucleotide transporter
MEDSTSFLAQLHAAIAALSWVEIWAVITGLVYVILAARAHIACWLFGIISSLLSIYLFYQGKLYAESILYFYYVIAGVYGWYAWSKQQSTEKLQNEKVQIHTWDIKQHGLTLLAGIFFIILLSYVLRNYTDAQLPVIDASTTIFSFIATYMVTRKVLENWLYWIVIDLVTTGMYFYRAFYLYALLMIVYTIIAVLGYIRWKTVYQETLRGPKGRGEPSV